MIPYLYCNIIVYLQLRSKLEETMKVKLQEYCAFIDNEMIKILRQMDAASMIFEYLYLGSEWNASNLKELKANGLIKYY